MSTPADEPVLHARPQLPGTAAVGGHGSAEKATLVSASDDGIHIELFAGAGGLAMGLAAAGLPPDHIFELDPACCDTLRHNSNGREPHITARIHQLDVATVDWSLFSERPVRLLSGGPPCQPFSLAGKHLANRDDRNQFPAILRAVRALQPSIVLLENVPGILRDSFATYFKYVIRQLEYPSIAPLSQETWEEHNARLAVHAQSRAPEYIVKHWTLNAADYGVPQARARLFLLAGQADLDIDLSRPTPTHSRAALRMSQASGQYWRDRSLSFQRRKRWPVRVHSHGDGTASGRHAWVTVRDALAGLPDPPEQDSAGNNHWLIPGARLYRGHCGSELDWPAKTIKAGVHGVPGGENVLLLDDDRYRYFTLREMARLQDFSDDYYFVGPRSRVIGQIGNAVPLRLAHAIGEQVNQAFDDAFLKTTDANPASRSPAPSDPDYTVQGLDLKS